MRKEICIGATVRYKRIKGYTPDIQDDGHVAGFGYYESGEDGDAGNYWIVEFNGKETMVNERWLELISGGRTWIPEERHTWNDPILRKYFGNSSVIIPAHWSDDPVYKQVHDAIAKDKKNGKK